MGKKNTLALIQNKISNLSCLLFFVCLNDVQHSVLMYFNPFPKQALVFTYLPYKSFEKTQGKGEIAHNEQFLLFTRRFLLFWRTICHFHPIENYLLQTLSIWKSINLLFGIGITLSFPQFRVSMTLKQKAFYSHCKQSFYQNHIHSK